MGSSLTPNLIWPVFGMCPLGHSRMCETELETPCSSPQEWKIINEISLISELSLLDCNEISGGSMQSNVRDLSMI